MRNDMLQPLRRLARRQTDRVAGPYMAALVAELQARLAESNGRIDALRQSVDQVHADIAQARGEIQGVLARQDELSLALRHVYEGDAELRHRLYALRTSEEYELAFTEADPLVSFVIPTYDRCESLRDVSLPSILAQTHSNIEVVVSGDCSPPETEAVVVEMNDPRVRYINRTVRGPYPDDRTRRWYMIGTPPYNDGVAAARGRWIAGLGDDDALRPNHTELLLEKAREQRVEHCYGRHLVHYPSGETLDIGGFPPKKAEFVLQASLYHAGLSFFQMEPADHVFSEPNDWSLCRRMVAAGVRFGMVDEIVADKYESRYQAHSDWSEYGLPSVE